MEVIRAFSMERKEHQNDNKFGEEHTSKKGERC